MKQSSRKFWLAFSFAIVAISAIFALKPAEKKEKPAQIVVDRLVNQLVCQTGNNRDSSSFRRGVLALVSQKILAGRWDHGSHDRDGGSRYTFGEDIHKGMDGGKYTCVAFEFRQKNIKIAC